MRNRFTKVLWVVGAVALLTVGVFVASHYRQRSALEEVLERHRARGLGTTLDDLLADAPAVDDALQERVWEWMRVKRGPEDDLPPDPERRETWFLAGRAAPPDEVARWLGAERSHAEALARLLRERPVLTSFGWLRADRHAYEKALPIVNGRQRFADAFRLFTVAAWFGTTALVEPASLDSLESLDLLRNALERSGGYMDSIARAICGWERDRTHLRLALRGTLPRERLDRWLAEPAEAERFTADAMRGERVLLWTPLARAILDGDSIAHRWLGEREAEDLAPARLWRQHVVPRVRGASDCAAVLEYLAALEVFLRTGSGADAVRDASARAQGLAWPFEGPHEPSGPMAMAVGHRLGHRLARLAVWVVLEARSERGLPTDDEDLRARSPERARILDAGPFDVGLRYERLEADRFRIARDLKVGTPPFYVVDDSAPEPTDETAWLRWSGDEVVVRLPPVLR